jgi:eukaryotic-like serine/threonine-protein kinase
MALRGGRYETLREIASGGMATVHLGRILGMGGFERVVAIKVMHPHIACDPQFVGMFLDEARLAARVRHPNVVGTIDILEDELGLFLVMEYIEGPSLTALIRAAQKRGSPLTLGVQLRIFLDALAGLHAAHQLTDGQGELLNLVHRDVSPQNILVGSDGIARITDFGVARARSRITTTKGHEVKGKMSYLAPEQVRAEPIDRRADIYSAGVILWGLLTGRRMIRADNDGAIVSQILAPTRPSPRKVNPEVPPALDEVCLAAIALDPADRPATAADFGEAIEAAAARDGVTIAPSRVVAALVKDLEAHEALGDLPTSKTPTSSSIPLQSGVVVRGDLSTSGVIPVIAEAASKQLVSEDNLPIPSVAPPSSTGVAAVVPTAPPARRTLAWGAVAIGVVVAALAIVTLVRGVGGGSATAAAPPSASAALAAPPDPPAPPAVSALQIASVAPAAIVTASAASSARAPIAPPPARSGKPIFKGSTPAASPTNFAPSEL